MTAYLDSATATTRARYDRLALRYDAMQSFTERRAFERWRRDENVRLAGLEIVSLEHLDGVLAKLIHARPGAVDAGSQP